MKKFSKLVKQELEQIRSKHRPLNSLHEGFAVLLEEVDELKEEVWKRSAQRDLENMLKECVQIACVAQRFAEDLGLLPKEQA